MSFASRLYSAFAVVSSADPDGFDWKGALVDAGIIAGLNFFSTLAGLGATGIIADVHQSLVAALVSAGLGFFSTLAVRRGLGKSGAVQAPKEPG